MSKIHRTVDPFTVIEVASVTPANTALPELRYRHAVEALLKKPPSPWGDEPGEDITQRTRPVEACSRYHGQLVAGVDFHAFLAGVHLAFRDHRGLVLSPERTGPARQAGIPVAAVMVVAGCRTCFRGGELCTS
jgi:hypothetical protein